MRMIKSESRREGRVVETGKWQRKYMKFKVLPKSMSGTESIPSSPLKLFPL